MSRKREKRLVVAKCADVSTVPRLIRLHNAPRFLGMDRHTFQRIVRPYLTEVPIGKRGIAFDRLELDAWVDNYKRCHGRQPEKRMASPDEKCSGSIEETKHDGARRESEDPSDWQRAVERVLAMKRRRTT